jgi:hypothetical protein
VKQHYQWPLPLADVTAPGEIDEVPVCQLKTFWHETGGGSSQPLWQYGLQMGIARPPWGMEVTLYEHDGDPKQVSGQ